MKLQKVEAFCSMNRAMKLWQIQFFSKLGFTWMLFYSGQSINNMQLSILFAPWYTVQLWMTQAGLHGLHCHWLKGLLKHKDRCWVKKVRKESVYCTSMIQLGHWCKICVTVTNHNSKQGCFSRHVMSNSALACSLWWFEWDDSNMVNSVFRVKWFKYTCLNHIKNRTFIFFIVFNWILNWNIL